MFSDGLNRLQKVRRFAFAPRGQCTIGDLERCVRDDQAFVKEQLDPKPVAIRARPKWRVERKEPRFNFGDGEATDRTGEILGKGEAFRVTLARRRLKDRNPVREIKRCAETVSQPGFQPLFHHKTVHYDVDVVAELLVEGWWFVQFVKLAVYLHPLEALLAQFEKFFAVFAFAVAHDRRKKIRTRAFLHRHYTIHHVLDLLGFDRQTRCGAVGRADTRK